MKPRARGHLAHRWHLCDLSSDPSLTKAHSLSPKPPRIPSIQGSEALLRSSSRSSLQPKRLHVALWRETRSQLDSHLSPSPVPDPHQPHPHQCQGVPGAGRDSSQHPSPFLAEALESRSRNLPFSPATSEPYSRTSAMV